MLRQYLKNKASIIALFCFWALFVILWFYFKELDMAALIYPLSVTFIVGLIMLVMGWFQEKENHERLNDISDFIGAVDNLPEGSTITEASLIDLIGRLDEVHSDTVRAFNKKTKETDDYYTMWVHQIKTPIAAMRLKLDSMDGEDVAALKSQLLRIEQYVDMVLIYHRLESADSDYRFSEVDIDEIVKGAVRRLRSDFISKNISLRYEVVPSMIKTDEKWLGFVIEQLLTNSLKYTNKGYIRIYNDADQVLKIEDTGIGILEEDIPRIFEKGFTGRNGRLDKRASGLGLYLCKRICDNLGHDISVESKVGEGTTVMLALSRPDRQFE